MGRRKKSQEKKDSKRSEKHKGEWPTESEKHSRGHKKQTKEKKSLNDGKINDASCPKQKPAPKPIPTGFWEKVILTVDTRKRKIQEEENTEDDEENLPTSGMEYEKEYDSEDMNPSQDQEPKEEENPGDDVYAQRSPTRNRDNSHVTMT